MTEPAMSEPASTAAREPRRGREARRAARAQRSHAVRRPTSREKFR